MNRMKYLSMMILAAVALSQNLQASAPTGQFVGVVHHDARPDAPARDQLAKLDFITYREGGKLKRLAIFTLQFGDFRSKEYLSFHYDDVAFLLEQGIYTFEDPSQAVSLHNMRMTGDKLEGDLVSKTLPGRVGKVQLERDGTAQPSAPLIEPVWGEYRGVCPKSINSGREGKIVTSIHLFTFRSNEETAKPGNPFAAYNVRGKIGEFTTLGSAPGQTNMMGWGSILSSSYNYFRNQLQFQMRNGTVLKCQTVPEGLSCDRCGAVLKRSTDETAAPRAMKPVVATNEAATVEAAAPAPGTTRALGVGDYYGYLHHEYLNQYQPVQLHVEKIQTLDVPKLVATASLFFGDSYSAAAKQYAFTTVTEPFPTNPTFVLKNPASDVDAVVSITPGADGVLRGTWYSLLFGRVGTFELHQQQPPSLPGGLTKFPSLEAKFVGPLTYLELAVRSDLSTVNSQNPFSPLAVEGRYNANDFGFVSRVGNSSYDFYTGRLGLDVGAIDPDSKFAPGNKIVVGNLDAAGDLHLRSVLFMPTAPHSRLVLQHYKREQP